MKDAGSLRHLRATLVLGNARKPQGEPHIVRYRHVRVERIGLEHHGEPALGGRNIVDPLPVDQKIAGGNLLQAGDHPQQGRFPASRGSDEDAELPVVDGKINPLDHLHRAVALLNALEYDGRHSTLPVYLTAPKVRPRTSWRWLIQPKTRMGAIAMAEAAESLAQNRPSGAENEAMNVVRGAAVEVGRFRLQNASFQHRMIDSRAVEAMPGSDSGSSRFQTSCFGLAPSMRPASRISLGTSLKKV